ncbi:hypothetical protein NKH16_20135 [Mesorhizobium sp. M1307]|uniref:hypothetical protein n=1 Tax=Mesorhizobium sp. M1307 TaxID=2957079 RepID=UPI003334B03B
MRTLDQLIEQSKALVAAMSPAEVAAMVKAQGESYARNYKPGERQCFVMRQRQQFQNVARD